MKVQMMCMFILVGR